MSLKVVKSGKKQQEPMGERIENESLPKGEIVSSVKVFDPNKSYRWNPGDTFSMSGTELSILYQVLKKKAQEAMEITQAFEAIHKVFEQGVMRGVITEFDPTDGIKEVPGR